MAEPQRQAADQARPPGSACVWAVAAVLLVAVLAGGGCLVLYLVLPPDGAPQWLPAAGLALVALPWAFWIATCAYRCCSSSPSTAAAPGNVVERQSSRPAAVAPQPSSKSLKGARSVKHDRSSTTAAGSSGGARRVHFGDAAVLGEEEDGGGGALETDDESSVHSHDSEAPLAYSMQST